MAFTDEDMELLRNSCKYWEDWGPKIIALLARLEAAEGVLNNLRGHEAETVDEDLMNRWLKVCGK